MNPSNPLNPRPDGRETGSRRARRVDARTNRERILSVAERVFGKGGPSASTEEVARLADVGIATVFRHFPTKAALLEAVLARRFDRLREQAESLADADDPGAAFFGFFRHLVSDAPGKLALGDALREAGGTAEGDAGRASMELRQAFGTLLVRAQAAGAVRGDVRLPEVYALLVALSRAAAESGLVGEVREGVLGVVFDGLAEVGRAG